MAVSKRGRMLLEDEQRIQKNTLFIEEEVDGADLVPSLYSATVIDGNDKNKVLAGRTRLDRIRCLVEILLFRGPTAFGEFLQSLENNGYDHVAFRIRNTVPESRSRIKSDDLGQLARRITQTAAGIGAQSVSNLSLENVQALTRCNTAPDGIFLTSTSFDMGGEDQPELMNSQSSHKQIQKRDSMVSFKRDSTVSLLLRDSDEDTPGAQDKCEKSGKSTDERLKKIEDAWFILSRRLTRVEDRATRTNDVPDEELHLIKEELADVKADTLRQIHDLVVENERKAIIIESLTTEVEERRAKLVEAQEKIESLEKRIVSLEAEKGRAEAEVRLLAQKLENHEKTAETQNEFFTTESLRIRNQMLVQAKKMKDQESAIDELKKREKENSQKFLEQEDELRDQRLQMQDQIQQLNLLTKVVHGIAQTGASGPPQQASNPTFCISGNNAQSHCNRNSNTARSKRSAIPSVYRGWKK